MIYLDANIFIYAAGEGTTKGERARSVIQAVQDGNIQAITSILTFDEAVWELRRQIGEEAAVTAVRSFFLLPDLAVCDVTRQIFLNALEIMLREKMKPRDAIHLATMRQNNVSKILSEDPDFDKARGVKRISLEEFRPPK